MKTRKRFVRAGILAVVVGVVPAPPSSAASDQAPTETVLDANTPAAASLLDEPPKVLRSPGGHSARRAGENLKARSIKPAGGVERSWYRGGLAALSAVLMLIALSAWGLKRFGRRGPLDSSAIEVLNKTCLSPKQSLALVRVGNKVILIGATSEQITHLTTIDDPTGVDLLTADVDSMRLPRPQFEGLLDRESVVYGADEDVEDHICSADLRIVKETRQNIRNLLSRVTTLKNAASA